MSGNFRKKKIALAGALMFVVTSVSAQTVKGVVTDNTGEPIIGASVMEVGQAGNGGITDIDGNFTVNLKGSSKKLKISYIGMKAKEINVAGKTTISVKLEDEANSLNDVVVIGYGTVKKKDLTGAVATVKGEDLTKVPVTNAAEALTGKLPGVQITTTDGSPDAEMIIKVRGGGSITGDNSPLYIVDGFPVSSIGDIAPSDIEDITVLKDAASTAIYGSQGANGVILVTTKGAKSGKTVVSYNGYVQGKSIAKTLDTMTPYQYVMYNYERAALRGTSDISSFEKRFGSFGDLDLYQYQQGHDWQNEMFGNHDLSQSHNVSVSGGSEKTKFNLSGTYTNDNSLMKTNGYDRFNVNFKLNHEICKNLKLDFGMRLADVTTKGVGTGGGTYKIRSYEAITKGPVNGLYDQLDIDPSTLPDDEYDEYISITRSLQDKVNDYWRRKNERRYNYNGAITWNFLKNFTYRAEAGYDYTFFQQKDYYAALSDKAVKDGGSLPMGEWTKKDTWKLRLTHTLTYNKTFNKVHNLNAMIGQEYVATNNESLSVIAKYFQKDIAPEKMFASLASNSGATGSRTINSSLGQEDRTLSFFGRLNYSYADRYLLTFTMRADGSSKLAPHHRWGYFPSFSGAWRVSNEKFMKDIKWIDDLKIRGGWGQTGNQSGLGDYSYLARYNINRVQWFGEGNDANSIPTFSQGNLSNPELTWETTTQTNIGLDLTVLGNRLTFYADYYYKKTKDMLMNITLPAGSAAARNLTYNGGSMINKGWEFAISSQNLTGALKWNTDFNISFNKNKLESLSLTQVYYEATTTDFVNEQVVRNTPGKPLGSFWGYVAEGVDPETGDMKYKDVTGDGLVSASDRTYIGNPNPDFTFGLTNTFSYKGLNLSILIQGSYGNDIYNVSRMETEGMYDGKNQSTKVLARWRVPGQITDVPKAKWDIRNSTYFVEDGSYLRVKDISLSYDVPRKLISRFGLTRLQPYVSATNLLTLTDYSGMDPEVNQYGNSGSVQGIDWGTYPLNKSVVLGVKVEF